MKRKLILIAIDIVMIVLLYIAAFVLRFELEEALNYKYFVYTSLPVLVVVTIGTFVRMGMYNAVWRYASVDSFVMVVKAITTSTLVSVVLVFFIQTYRIPRSIFVIYWMLLLIGMGGVRFSTRFYRYYFMHRKKKGYRVLIYGAGSAGQMIAKEMKHDPLLGYNPVCFVDDDPNKIGRSIHSLPIYSGTVDLDEIIRENSIKEVLVAIPSSSGVKIREIIDSCKTSQVRFKTLPSLSDIVGESVSVSQIREIEIDDLLRRAPKDLDMNRIESFVADKSVLITGAGGSIGSEL